MYSPDSSNLWTLLRNTGWVGSSVTNLNLHHILGFSADEPVVTTSLDLLTCETRAMQTPDGNIKLSQAKEGNRWVLFELIDPITAEWYKIKAIATFLRISTIHQTWAGPLGDIPREILSSDEPLMIRSTRRPGWQNLRVAVKMACQGEA